MIGTQFKLMTILGNHSTYSQKQVGAHSGLTDVSMTNTRRFAQDRKEQMRAVHQKQTGQSSSGHAKLNHQPKQFESKLTQEGID